MDDKTIQEPCEVTLGMEGRDVAVLRVEPDRNTVRNLATGDEFELSEAEAKPLVDFIERYVMQPAVSAFIQNGGHRLTLKDA